MIEFLKELPIDELDCYRKASAWGMEDTKDVRLTGTNKSDLLDVLQ